MRVTRMLSLGLIKLLKRFLSDTRMFFGAVCKKKLKIQKLGRLIKKMLKLSLCWTIHIQYIL
jgi:hypothetical protein